MKTQAHYHTVISALGAAALMLVTSLALATPKPDSAHTAIPNLINVSSKYFDKAKSREAEAWRGIDQIFIEPSTLAFSSYWLREHKHNMTDSDEKRIRESYTEALQETLTEAFEKQGWKIASEVTPTTLIIKPELTDLRIQAPDLSMRPIANDYVTHVGSSRLSLTFAVGDHANVVGFLEDHDETRNWGGLGDMKPTNRAVNYRDFKFLFEKWSKRAAEFAINVSQASMVSKGAE